MSISHPQVTIPNTQVLTISSSHVNQEFRIFIALPPTYNNLDKNYPVLYLLDANVSFGTVTETVGMLSIFKETPEMVIVGIGYPVNSWIEILSFRTRDYTPTVKDEWYEANIKPYLPEAPEYAGSGGAVHFLEFIRSELMPFIHSNYRINAGEQAILGHSFGGLFALYTLFHHPDTFFRYIIGSPVISWDEGVIFQYEREFAANNTDLSVKIFMSAGSNESEHMVPNMKKFVQILRGRKYQNLDIKTHIFEDETHFSVVPATTSRGLKAVFGGEHPNFT